MVPELVPKAGVCLPFSDQKMNPERKKSSSKFSQSEKGQDGALIGMLLE